MYLQDTKINIVDTQAMPTWREVERIVKMVDGVLLLVTPIRSHASGSLCFKKGLAAGLKPLVMSTKLTVRESI